MPVFALSLIDESSHNILKREHTTSRLQVHRLSSNNLSHMHKRVIFPRSQRSTIISFWDHCLVDRNGEVVCENIN